MQAIHQSQGVCVLPFGIIEKHGPHLPLGTDLLDVRFAVMNAVQQEYAVVFPEYYFGQIFEAQQQPGTLAYSLATQLTLLQETVKEMARNGCKKVLIVNGHGGNESLLPLFATGAAGHAARLRRLCLRAARKNVPGRPALKTPKNDMHAGEVETSHMLVARPDLVHIDRADSESGADQNRLQLPESVYTGIWWYAKFPRSLFGQRLCRQQGTGRVRPEDVVAPDRRSHQGQSRLTASPQAAKRVLREDAPSAGHETVGVVRGWPLEITLWWSAACAFAQSFLRPHNYLPLG